MDFLLSYNYVNKNVIVNFWIVIFFFKYFKWVNEKFDDVKVVFYLYIF